MATIDEIKTELGDTEVTEGTESADDGFDAGDAVAFLISVGDGLLPLGDVRSIVGLVSKSAASKLDKVVEENPTAATSGLVIGSVLGLVGGPAVLAAKGGSGLLKFVSAIAKGRAKGVTRGKIDEAKDILSKSRKQLDEVDPDFESDEAANLLRWEDEVEALNDAWKTLERQTDFSDNIKLDSFRNLMKNVSDDNPLKATKNPYQTFINREPSKVADVTGGSLKKVMQEMYRQGSYKTSKFGLSLASPFIEAIGSVSADFLGNFLWSYDNFRNQGISKVKAVEFGLLYALDKSPEEAIIETTQKLLKNVPILGRTMNISGEAVKAMLRLEDVNFDTGDIESIGGKPIAKNYGGLITPIAKPSPVYRRYGGLIKM